MATLREQINKGIKAGITGPAMKARMIELGLRKEDADLDYEEAKKLGASRLTAGIQDIMALTGLKLKAPVPAPTAVQPVQAPVAPVAAPKPAVAEQAPVGLPSEVQETVQETGVPDIRMRGGIVDPAGSLKRAAGYAVGAMSGAAGGMAEVIDEKDPRYDEPRKTFKKSVLEGEAGQKKDLKKGEVDLFSYGFAKNAASDVLDLVTLLPKVASIAFGSFETKEGEDVYESGIRAGQKLAGSVLGSTAVSLQNKEAAVKAHPVMFLFDVLPVLKGVGAASKALAVTKTGAKVADVAKATKTAEYASRMVSGIEKYAGELAKKYSDKYGVSLAPQRFIDLYTTRDPRVTEFLEDTFAEGDRIEGVIKKGGEALLGSKKDRPSFASTAVKETIETATGQPAKELFSKALERGDIITEATTKLPDHTISNILRAVGETNADIPDILRAYKVDGPRALLRYLDEGQQNMLRGVILGKDNKWARIVGEKLAKKQKKALRQKVIANAADDARTANISRIMKDESTKYKNGIPNGERPMALETSARSVDEYIKEAGLNVVDSEALKKKIARMEYREIEGFRGLVDPRVAYVIDVQNTTGITSKFYRNMNILTNKLPKQVALAINPRAIMNNIIGNEFATAMRFGGIPFNPKRLAIANRYQRWKLGPKKGAPLVDTGLAKDISRVTPLDEAFFKSLERSGVFDSNLVKKDIDLLSSVGTGEWVGKVGDILATPGGKLMSWGDEVYKLDVARKEYDRALRLMKNLKEGEHIILPVGPNQSIRIRKSMDGSYGMARETTGRGITARRTKPRMKHAGTGEVVNGVPNKQLSDVLARFGGQSAFTQYFDYGRIPGFLGTVRKTPGVGAGSVFFTWQNKALDIPGVKKGLGSSIIGGPAGITSNSAKVNAVIAADHLALAAKRAAITGLAKEAGLEDPETRKRMSWDPKNPSVSIATTLSDPTSVALNRFSSSNWMEPSLNLMELGVTALAPGKKELDAHLATLTAKDKTQEQKKAAWRKGIKVLHAMGTRNKDVVPTMLKLVGLGGGILMDVYSNAMDAEDQGKSFNILDTVKKVYVPSWLRSGASELAGDQSRRLAGVPAGKKQLEDTLSFHIRNILGTGFQQIDNIKSYERYRRGAGREMRSQMESWKDKRLKETKMKELLMSKDLKVKAAATKEFGRLTVKEELFKEAVRSALTEMDVNFYSSLQKPVPKRKENE